MITRMQAPNPGPGAVENTGHKPSFTPLLKTRLAVAKPLADREGSNSGIYLRGRYEMQGVDQYGLPPHSRGNGGIYGYIAPAVNAVKPAGEWNTLDATIIGYRVTIVLNGRNWGMHLTPDGPISCGLPLPQPAREGNHPAEVVGPTPEAHCASWRHGGG